MTDKVDNLIHEFRVIHFNVYCLGDLVLRLGLWDAFNGLGRLDGFVLERHGVRHNTLLCAANNDEWVVWEVAFIVQPPTPNLEIFLFSHQNS